MRFLQTLLAFVTGVVAAIMWLDRHAPPERSSPAPQTPAPPPPEPERVVDRVVERVVVPDPEQAERIEQLEAQLEEQLALFTSEPTELNARIDAIRAARMHALELERRLSGNNVHGGHRWHELEPPALEDVVDAVADHLPRVALWVQPDPVDPGKLWRALGAMQEYAEASEDAWFEFVGDFAGWCRQSGHPHALDPDQVGEDEERPEFQVELRVNRSGQMVVPTYVEVEILRLHYVDDVAGETGRMHVVGLG